MSLPQFYLASLPEDLRTLTQQWQSGQPLQQENEIRLWQRLRLEWNYNSNHIEGNTLTYGETLLLLIHGRTRGEHLMREYVEMRGHDVAIEWLRPIAADARFLTEGDIRDLNRMVLKEGFWKVAQTTAGEPTRKWIEPGKYKSLPNSVLTKTGEMYYFTKPEETPARMAEFVVWMRTELETPSLGLAQFIVQLHHRFIQIHPFDDGNGRVVRLLVNYVLLRVGLLPLIIKSRTRRRYLEVIVSADAGDFEPFEIYVTEGLRWSLNLGLTAAHSLVDLQTDEE